MIKIFGDQSSKKTKSLLKEAALTNSYILSSNKRALYQKAKSYKIDLPEDKFVEFSDLKSLPINAPIMIDDFISLFTTYAENAWSIKVEGLSFTGEE